MLQEKINKTILAENAAPPLGPLHGKSLWNPSPLFGLHVICQARTRVLYTLVLCPHFPFISGSFAFIFSFGVEKKQPGLCLNAFAKQAVSLVHWHQQLILPALGKKTCDRNPVSLQSSRWMCVPCKGTGTENILQMAKTFFSVTNCYILW